MLKPLLFLVQGVVILGVLGLFGILGDSLYYQYSLCARDIFAAKAFVNSTHCAPSPVQVDANIAVCKQYEERAAVTIGHCFVQKVTGFIESLLLPFEESFLNKIVGILLVVASVYLAWQAFESGRARQQQNDQHTQRIEVDRAIQEQRLILDQQSAFANQNLLNTVIEQQQRLITPTRARPLLLPTSAYLEEVDDDRPQ